MTCNCDSRLDSIMTIHEEMRAEIGFMKTEIGAVKEEIGFVKTKCIRIEKEILGITAESELNAEALMETTTVRHLVEKLAFDVGVLTKESKLERAESERQKERETAIEDLPRKFSEATSGKIKDLLLKYDMLDPKTFQVEFSNFLEELRSHTEKDMLKKGFSSAVIHDMVEEVTKTTVDFGSLYEIHFSEKNKNMERAIREKYSKVVEVYAKKAIDKMDDFTEIGLQVITEFLNQFKLCEDFSATFQEELFKELQKINEQIEANRGLLDRLTEECRQYLPSRRLLEFPHRRFNELEARLEREINVTDPKLVPLFLKKLRQNMNNAFFFGRK